MGALRGEPSSEQTMTTDSHLDSEEALPQKQQKTSQADLKADASVSANGRLKPQAPNFTLVDPERNASLFLGPTEERDNATVNQAANI